MKYKMNSPFRGFSIDFINISVRQMYNYEIRYGELDRLLNNDEQMDLYIMQIGCMHSEIGIN